MPLSSSLSVSYRPASWNWDAGRISLFSLMTCFTDWNQADVVPVDRRTLNSQLTGTANRRTCGQRCWQRIYIKDLFLCYDAVPRSAGSGLETVMPIPAEVASFATGPVPEPCRCSGGCAPGTTRDPGDPPDQYPMMRLTQCLAPSSHSRL